MGSLPQLPADMLLKQMQNGLGLLLLGMGTVFIFLIILVFVIKAMSAIIKKMSHEKASAPVASPIVAAVAPASGSPDAEVAAAIVAAVAQSQK